ncbi:hypothetical protein HanXRQr2_Chr05g0233591 [Helianthus annuus]|uniref:Uncharacterized protein n=1 Tax=Helianthus annuus TaxID=4232 RepID=A0A9K3J279_HELAN|nr:hypothetical protein HanXRQr2_Chr05g0233591 [Helianthus annuus]
MNTPFPFSIDVPAGIIWSITSVKLDDFFSLSSASTLSRQG